MDRVGRWLSAGGNATILIIGSRMGSVRQIRTEHMTDWSCRPELHLLPGREGDCKFILKSAELKY